LQVATGVDTDAKSHQGFGTLTVGRQKDGKGLAVRGPFLRLGSLMNPNADPLTLNIALFLGWCVLVTLTLYVMDAVHDLGLGLHCARDARRGVPDHRYLSLARGLKWPSIGWKWARPSTYSDHWAQALPRAGYY
jgi:hypothetical protein